MNPKSLKVAEAQCENQHRIRDELEAHGDLQDISPPLAETKPLCEFVTDGRALCQLTNAVLESEAEELPKKLHRSLKQLSKFHALDHLEEHQVFTTVQLLDEVNETAVSETIVALRNKTRPGIKANNSMSQYYFDRDSNARVSTSSITSSGSNSANNANRLSSFLKKTSISARGDQAAYEPPRVAHVQCRQQPVPEPVPTDEENSKSRLRIPSIFESNNNNINTSATSRSNVISNALGDWHLWWFGNATMGYPPFKGLQPSDFATKIKRKRYSEWTNLIKHLCDAVKSATGRDL
ncbi:hypothetical protein PHMEG_00016649 [Phytophthora megakarya]|uniref:Calponin-homology (CH) domain-containing protein n=1 Tax=Phytophthora megakarya TaxID=4795 RepID=A0A225VZV3_9STRA|nr:hypothetical protein PHMEG_00016649 [Phytophthora megakarya]